MLRSVEALNSITVSTSKHWGAGCRMSKDILKFKRQGQAILTAHRTYEMKSQQTVPLHSQPNRSGPWTTRCQGLWASVAVISTAKDALSADSPWRSTWAHSGLPSESAFPTRPLPTDLTAALLFSPAHSNPPSGIPSPPLRLLYISL